MIGPKRASKSQQRTKILLALFPVCASVFLYLCLFRLPCTPIFGGGDENVFLIDATRTMDGKVMYRDFFELVAPGLAVVNVVLFKCLGVRSWIPNLSLVLVGLGLTSLIISISRKVLSGAATYLPAALFLTWAFGFVLDDTHQWYSAVAELGAVATVVEKRTRSRLLAAGALFGLASFFTQTQGVFAVVGLSIFLLWEGRRAAEPWLTILGRLRCLLVSFVAMVLVTSAYFVWRAGPARFLYCTLIFVLKHYSADQESNALYALWFEFGHMAHWRELLSLGQFLFIHAVVPLVYVLFWMRCRREALSPDQRNRLVLLTIMGLLLFASVAPAPTTYRLCGVAPLGLILLVWLVNHWSRTRRVLSIVLWIGALGVAVAFPLSIQTHKMYSLDVPRGRLAMDQTQYEKLLWLSQHTSPGEYLFTAASTEVLFPLALRNPSEVPFVKANNYTRPEQVRNIVAALEEHRVRLVLSDPGLDFQGTSLPRIDHVEPPRGHLRSFLHVIKTFLGGNPSPKEDNLGPLRSYLHSCYHLSRLLPDNTEAWERDSWR